MNVQKNENRIKTQTGFTVIEGVLILALVGIIGFTGYRVYTVNQNTNDTLNKSDDVADQNIISNEDNSQSLNSITDEKELDDQKAIESISFPNSDLVTILSESEWIKMQDFGDEDKLPDYTPDSFVGYMKNNLKNNIPDEYGCVTLYTVSQISIINISGGIGDMAFNGDSSDVCGGGAAMYWYLQDGKWQTLGLQDAPSCDTLKNTNIYGQFIPTCWDENNNAAKNPNGSIDDAL